MNIDIFWEVLSSVCEMRLSRLSLFPTKIWSTFARHLLYFLTSVIFLSNLLQFPHPQTYPEMGQYQPFSVSTIFNSSITLQSASVLPMCSYLCSYLTYFDSSCFLVLSSFDLLINLLPLPTQSDLSSQFNTLSTTHLHPQKNFALPSSFSII